MAARECLVVASRRETVEAGLQVLQAGGNAVDAAVCMAFVAAVAEPTEASIGGSGFMLIHDGPDRLAWSVEFPPRAPKAASADMFEPVPDRTDSRFAVAAPVCGDANATGPLAPCVPGLVAGLCLARQCFGQLPLPRLVEPAIDLADSGFEVDAYYTLQALANLDALLAGPAAERAFLSGGLPPVAPFAAAAEPPRLRQPDLADTLRAIAARGPDGFYRGSVAKAIARAFREEGGLMTEADLDGYRADVERPLERSYRGWSVLSPRAPCGAWTAMQALAILEQVTKAGLDRRGAARLHLLAEALRAAFADRYRFASDAPSCPERLLSDARVRDLARSIRRDRASTRALPAAPGTQDAGHGTTHLSVIDSGGRMVSCTVTAGNTFGSKFVADGTGVLFDSGMAWFDPRPGAANSIAPGKRPLVNMAPVLLVKDGRPRLALGAAGGRRIISAVTQVVGAIVDHGLAVQEAISAPRLDASEPRLRLSDRFGGGVAAELAALGHDVLPVREQHAPFSYELARPAAAGSDEKGVLSGGIHPCGEGYVAGR